MDSSGSTGTHGHEVSEGAAPSPPVERKTNWKRTALLCVLILLVAAGVAAITFITEPTATRGGAMKQTAMLVDVTGVERGTYRPTIVATGAVTAEEDIVLRPQVGGQIVARAEEFTPGGVVEKGQTLLRVDPADYRHLVQQRQSELRQAKTELELEMGRQKVARKDYELFGKGLGASAQEGLMLRQPQLEAAQVRVDAARAALEQARLNLRRATVEAPFDAQVLRRDVNVGSQVAPGDSLGRLVGVQTYWVVAAVPLTKLRWIDIPEEPGERGAKVRVENRATWPAGAYRVGYVDELIGALDEQTRLARVLISIPDPLAREAGPARERPRLMVGEFVELRIQGEPIEHVIRLDRDYLRDGDTVWTMQDGRLRVREVEVVMRDAVHAYIAGGLDEDARVVTSNLATVTEGAELRVREGEAPAS